MFKKHFFLHHYQWYW